MKKEDLKTVVLRPDILGGSLGITLAGGTDYETKEICVSIFYSTIYCAD